MDSIYMKPYGSWIENLHIYTSFLSLGFNSRFKNPKLNILGADSLEEKEIYRKDTQPFIYSFNLNIQSFTWWCPWSPVIVTCLVLKSLEEK